MVSLNELCDLPDPPNSLLRQACALPRTPSDMNPLPEPHLDALFDSSWEALLMGTSLMEKWSD
jgi:hypothetical protein